MSDLIDRKQVIGAISVYANRYKEHIGKPDDSEVYAYSRGLIASIEMSINALPSAQQWVPVTERLPEELEEVNITWTNTDPPSYYEFIKGVPFTATGVYYKGEWYWYSANVIDLLSEGYKCETMDKKIKVVAWMPLPEPYEEGE